MFFLGIPNDFFKFGSPVIGFIALIPFYISMKNARSWKNGAVLGFLHATFVHILSSSWLSNFKDFAVFTLGASAAGTGVIGAFFGSVLYFSFCRQIFSEELIFRDLQEDFCRHNKACSFFRYFSVSETTVRTVFFAAVWTLWEWTKSNGFLGYPWGTLSMTAYRYKSIIQIADITGTYGITFLLALFSANAAEFILFTCKDNCEKCRNKNPLKNLPKPLENSMLLCIVLLASAHFYGFHQYSKIRTPEKFLDVLIVQQNTDPWTGQNDLKSIRTSQKLCTEKLNEKNPFTNRILSKPDLIVWSEAVLRYPFPQGQNYYSNTPPENPLLEYIDKTNVPFIIGAPYTIDRKNRLFGNAAVLIDASGNFKGAYCKIHLVPFAEVIPGIEFSWVRNAMKSMVGFSNGWQAGNQYTLFEVNARANPNFRPISPIVYAEKKSTPRPTVKFCTPICFEDAFPSVCRKLSQSGAELFVNLTDDSWSLTSYAEYQHFVIAAMRSIEFRKTMIRSTNSGYSAVIDPAGRILKDLPLFEQAAMRCTVPVYQNQTTVFEKFGFLFTFLCLIFAVLVFGQKKISRQCAILESN